MRRDKHAIEEVIFPRTRKIESEKSVRNRKHTIVNLTPRRLSRKKLKMQYDNIPPDFSFCYLGILFTSTRQFLFGIVVAVIGYINTPSAIEKEPPYAMITAGRTVSTPAPRPTANLGH